MAISERTEIVAVGTATSFLQWTPVSLARLWRLLSLWC